MLFFKCTPLYKLTRRTFSRSDVLACPLSLLSTVSDTFRYTKIKYLNPPLRCWCVIIVDFSLQKVKLFLTIRRNILLFRLLTFNVCFVFALFVFKGAYSRGQPGDRSGNLAARLHPAGLWSARRVRVYPTTSHQFDAATAAPAPKNGK